MLCLIAGNRWPGDGDPHCLGLEEVSDLTLCSTLNQLEDNSLPMPRCGTIAN